MKTTVTAVGIAAFAAMILPLLPGAGVVAGNPLTEEQAYEYCVERNGFNNHIENPEGTQEALTNFANSAGKLACSIDHAS